MKKQIVVISFIVVCLCGMSGCGISQAAEFDNKDNFPIVTEDIKYSELSVKDTIKSSEKNNIVKEKEEEKTTVEETIEESQETVIEESQETMVKESELEETPINEEEIVVEEFLPEEEIVEEIVVEEPQENVNGEGLTQESGVNYYDGRTETYYSSNVLYHQDTENWTLDDEGFYRTDEGYYVVAASDMPEGTTFEGSKGTCIALDSGCDEGTTDYYVNWWV